MNTKKYGTFEFSKAIKYKHLPMDFQCLFSQLLYVSIEYLHVFVKFNIFIFARNHVV